MSNLINLMAFPEDDPSYTKDWKYIYMIKCHSNPPCFKFGISKDPERRTKELATGNHQRIDLIGKVGALFPESWESWIHSQFALWKTKGEWYELPKDEAEIAFSFFRNNIGLVFVEGP